MRASIIILAFLGMVAGSALPLLPVKAAPRLVAFDGNFPRGTIVIRTGQRRLYLTTRRGEAISYPVAVGKRGKLWHGETRIRSKHVRPAWSPPEDVWRDNPKLPAVIPPGPRNPMGERAMVLARDQYAIHGTNRPETIGRYVSYGCIRMYNEDIVDLFDRVRVGTRVIVIR